MRRKIVFIIVEIFLLYICKVENYHLPLPPQNHLLRDCNLLAPIQQEKRPLPPKVRKLSGKAIALPALSRNNGGCAALPFAKGKPTKIINNK
jgi:hypothetical protein